MIFAWRARLSALSTAGGVAIEVFVPQADVVGDRGVEAIAVGDAGISVSAVDIFFSLFRLFEMVCFERATSWASELITVVFNYHF
jgi:hypothetical protein